MELGYNVVIPTHVLLDVNLAPLERVLYGVVVAHTNQNGHCTADLEVLAKSLRFKSDGVLKQVGTESLEKMLVHLESLGHVKYDEVDGGGVLIPIFQKSDITVSIKPKVKSTKSEEHKDLAIQVLSYLSKACIIRGYKKSEFKPTKTNLELINARLNDGHPYEDCISVVNIKFSDEFFTSNPKYLSPHTLFRPTNFEKYLIEAQSSKVDMSKLLVAKTGYVKSSAEPQAKNVEGVAF